jgi:hypothetical protein
VRPVEDFDALPPNAVEVDPLSEPFRSITMSPADVQAVLEQVDADALYLTVKWPDVDLRHGQRYQRSRERAERRVR